MVENKEKQPETKKLPEEKTEVSRGLWGRIKHSLRVINDGAEDAVHGITALVAGGAAAGVNNAPRLVGMDPIAKDWSPVSDIRGWFDKKQAENQKFLHGEEIKPETTAEKALHFGGEMVVPFGVGGAAVKGTKATGLLSKTFSRGGKVTGKADDLAKAATKTGPVKGSINVSAKATIEAAPGSIKKYLGKPMTLGRSMKFAAAGAAVPTAAAVVDVESGGAVSEASIETLFNTAEYAMENGIPYAEETLNTAAKAAKKVAEYSNAEWHAAQNMAVKAALGEKTDTGYKKENISKAKAAAIGVQITTPLALAADMYFIKRSNNIKYGDLPEQEKQKHLAESVIDRLVERSNFHALKDHPVTEQDIKSYLIENREKLLNSDHIPDDIKQALKAHIPELNVEKHLTKASNKLGGFTELDVGTLKGDKLNQVFNKVDDIIDDADVPWQVGLTMNIIEGASKVFNVINFGGWADGLIDHMQKFALRYAQDYVKDAAADSKDKLVSQFGDRFDLTKILGKKDAVRPQPQAGMEPSPLPSG
jgi:hypothetical protein